MMVSLMKKAGLARRLMLSTLALPNLAAPISSTRKAHTSLSCSRFPTWLQLVVWPLQ